MFADAPGPRHGVRLVVRRLRRRGSGRRKGVDMRVDRLETGATAAAKGRRPGEPSAAAARVQACGADGAELSRMALLMKTLHDLELQQPDKYRQAMGAISSHLGEAAAADPGGSADLLRALSRKFGEVSGGGAATSAREAAVPRAYRQAAADHQPKQLEEILQAALAEVGA
jgi:hypothetical protein